MSGEDIIRRQAHLRGERSTWDANWEELAEYILPRRADFVSKRVPGEKRTQKLFDSTPIHANELFAAGLQGMMTNPTTKWFRLRVVDDDVNDRESVKEWLEDAENRMFVVFNRPTAAFAPSIHEVYLDLGALGTSAMFIAEQQQGLNRVLFKTFHLGEIDVLENASGLVDTIYRKFSFTAKQMAEQWGEDNISPDVRKVLNTKPGTPFDIVWEVKPRNDSDPNRRDSKGLAFSSIYVECKTTHILSESGFHEFPFVVPRTRKLSNEKYGRSPGWTALPDIKMLNKMSETTLLAAQKAASPPLLAPDDGVISPIRAMPNAVTYGGMDLNGRELIKPLQNNANIGISLEMMDQRRASIREAFFVMLFQTPESPVKTATQVLQENDERLRLMGPMLGRLQTELLGPMVDRVFNILLRGNSFLNPPEELSGQDIRVEYVSPLAKAQQSSELLGISRAFELLAQHLEIKPDIVDNYDGDELARHIFDLNAVSHKIINDPEKIQQVREQRAALAEQEQQAQDAERLAQGVKTASEAEKNLANV